MKREVTELQEKGVLNTTIDPSYRAVWISSKLDEQNEQKSELGDSRERKIPLVNKAKGLDILEEDRTIGVVSFKLYWEYFRSGMHSSVIFAVICLCFITQGKVSIPCEQRLSKKIEETLLAG